MRGTAVARCRVGVGRCGGRGGGSGCCIGVVFVGVIRRTRRQTPLDPEEKSRVSDACRLSSSPDQDDAVERGDRIGQRRERHGPALLRGEGVRRGQRLDLLTDVRVERDRGERGDPSRRHPASVFFVCSAACSSSDFASVSSRQLLRRSHAASGNRRKSGRAEAEALSTPGGKKFNAPSVRAIEVF